VSFRPMSSYLLLAVRSGLLLFFSFLFNLPFQNQFLLNLSKRWLPTPYLSLSSSRCVSLERTWRLWATPLSLGGSLGSTPRDEVPFLFDFAYS